MKEAGIECSERAGASVPGQGAGPVGGLADLLVASLDALARAGQADAACRMAGHACAVLRPVDAREWQKFNVLLHRLSRLVGPDGS